MKLKYHVPDNIFVYFLNIKMIKILNKRFIKKYDSRISITYFDWYILEGLLYNQNFHACLVIVILFTGNKQGYL